MLQPSQVLQDPLALSSCSGNIYQQDQKQNVWILLKIMGFPAGFVTSGWATAVHKQITNHSGSWVWDIFRRSGEQYLKFTYVTWSMMHLTAKGASLIMSLQYLNGMQMPTIDTHTTIDYDFGRKRMHSKRLDKTKQPVSTWKEEFNTEI